MTTHPERPDYSSVTPRAYLPYDSADRCMVLQSLLNMHVVVSDHVIYPDVNSRAKSLSWAFDSVGGWKIYATESGKSDLYWVKRQQFLAPFEKIYNEWQSIQDGFMQQALTKQDDEIFVKPALLVPTEEETENNVRNCYANYNYREALRQHGIWMRNEIIKRNK